MKIRVRTSYITMAAMKNDDSMPKKKVAPKCVPLSAFLRDAFPEARKAPHHGERVNHAPCDKELTTISEDLSDRG